MKDLSVVIPCYKEKEEIVEAIYHELTKLGAEVIVVDDGANMNLTIPHIEHYPNMGYGYALKQGIRTASRPLVLTMDGDSQHQVKDVVILYSVFKCRNDLSMIIGNRWNIEDSPLRWFFRKCINFTASIISGHYQPDLNSGMRIFRRDIAIGYEQILCDTFSFTTSLTMATTTDNHKIVYFPIDVLPREYGKSRVRLLRDGLVTVYFILWVGLALRTRKIRSYFRKLFGAS